MKTRIILLITLCFCISTTIEAQDPTQKLLQGIMGSKKIDKSKLPDAYNFEWEFKTIMKRGKDALDMNYLINLDSNYFGMQMSSKEYKQIDFMCMVMNPKYSYKEIGTKQILGYECYGIELENADYIGTLYFTLEAPVNFSALFAFGKKGGSPNGFDPVLLEVLEEDALLMEIDGLYP